MGTGKTIMIVAGEASGDSHGAKLVQAIREAEPETAFKFFGAAGPRLRDAGVEAVVRADELSIVGLLEIGSALPMFFRAFRDLRRAAVDRNPNAIILVDFPDFNLKLAKSLRRKGFKIIYYISPQLWAWRKYRIRTIRDYVDLVITILPFEKDWYAKHGISKVEYVGSPLAREVHADVGKEDFCREHGLDPARPIVCLLPGSRHKEIVRILPVMLAAAVEISKRVGDVQFLIAASSDRSKPDIDNITNTAKSNGIGVPEALRIVQNETYNALNAADAAAVASGTATLETGIIGTPMVIVYKTSALNYKLLEPMIDVPHYGLINLIAEKRVAKEFIQNEFTAATLSEEILRLLEPTVNAKMRAELRLASDKLGHGGASKRAAQLILTEIRAVT